jgi:hypothetical protein
MYDRVLQLKCLEIRQSGIGLNGQLVLFNRKARRPGQPKAQPRIAPDKMPDQALLDAVKGLGLNATPQAVAEAVAILFPDGTAGMDQADVIRRVFLHLHGKK